MVAPAWKPCTQEAESELEVRASLGYRVRPGQLTWICAGDYLSW